MTQLNVVVLVLDTARASTVASGLDQNEFPVIGGLASEGTIYKRAFSSAPWTLPSHASIFTGCYPSKHGAHAGHKKLTEASPTLAGAFQENGYETVAVSNNVWVSKEFGLADGFDTFRKNWQYIQQDVDLGRISQTRRGGEKFRVVGRRLLSGNPLINVVNAMYGKWLWRGIGDDGARRTNDWIERWLTNREDNSPFFLFVNYLEPHLEYRPPKSLAERHLPDGVSFNKAMEVPQDAWEHIAGLNELTEKEFEILRALYRAEIAYLDKRIRQLCDSLKAQADWENTVLVVTGDHGENIGDHGLMDHQYCLYDTLLHVPLVIHGGSIGNGGAVDDLVQLTDIGPTLLNEVGIEGSVFQEWAQGRSFHKEAPTSSRNWVFAEYLAPQPSMESLKRKFGNLPDQMRQYNRSLRAIRSEEWKLIRASDGSTELYNISTDPAESNDIAASNPDTVDHLENKLDNWLDSFSKMEVNGDVSLDSDAKARLEDLGYLH